MAAAVVPETVWVGFMDDFPVVGKVKEVVEWILAMYEVNKAAVLETERAFIKLLEEPVEEREMMPKLTKKSEAAGASVSEFSGLQNVREVEVVNLHKYVKDRQTKPQKKDGREKILKAFQENINRNLLPLRLNQKLVESLKEELMRPGKHRHVFNEDILQFHSKVLKEFVEIQDLRKRSNYNQEQIMKLGGNTLDSKTETEIQRNMVVDFDEAELYVNANALLYGKCCEMLHFALISMMESGTPEHVSTEQKKKVKTIVDNMIRFDLYIDHMAKNKWIRTKSDVQKFSEVRAKVVRMYEEERGVQWVTEVLKELKPLLETDTVWVGFMDIIPVIGTVREGVEWVLAVYEENKNVMKEKEEAIFKLLHESVEERVMKLTSTQKTKAAAATALGSTEPLVEAVEVAKLPEYLTCGKRGQTKSQKKPKEQTMTPEQKENELEKIKAEVAEKLRRIGADPKLSEQLKIEINRSGRGEHVFNNNILKFHSALLWKYVCNLTNCNITDIQQQTENLGKHTFTPDIKNEIGTNMVVDFEKTEFYVNANALLYGRYSEALRQAFFQLFHAKMREADSSVQTQNKANVKEIINSMNQNKIYVDDLAKQKWIQANNDKLKRFNKVKDEVAKMYSETRGAEWGINVVKPIIDLVNSFTTKVGVKDDVPVS